MKKALMIASVLLVAVISTACINNIAIQELNNKAAEYMEKGQYELAMERLQASLELDNTMYETYYNLGIAAMNAKKYEQSIDAFKKVLELKPDSVNAYYSLGIAQSDYADEIFEHGSNLGEDVEDSEKSVEVSSEDKQKALTLKKEAIENMKKYIAKFPSADDMDAVNDLIKEMEDFVKKNS